MSKSSEVREKVTKSAQSNQILKSDWSLRVELHFHATCTERLQYQKSLEFCTTHPTYLFNLSLSLSLYLFVVKFHCQTNDKILCSDSDHIFLLSLVGLSESQLQRLSLRNSVFQYMACGLALLILLSSSTFLSISAAKTVDPYKVKCVCVCFFLFFFSTLFVSFVNGFCLLNSHQVLGVERNASQREIQKAFHK